MITRWVPETLRPDVAELANNFTKDLGGQVIEGPVLGQGQEAPQAAAAPHQQPEGGHGSFERQEAQEPAASAPTGTTTHKGGRSRR